MSFPAEKFLTLLTGSNGSSKTIFAKTVYPDFIQVGLLLNADMLAEKMNPEDVGKSCYRGWKETLNRMNS